MPYNQDLLMDLIFILPVATYSSQILLHSIPTPQLMPLSRTSGQNLGLLPFNVLKSSLANCILEVPLRGTSNE